MPAFEVSRTLVKSPPEVWAELEQVERLAALLSDDAIKITKTDPEKAIEWEGDGAHGRIEIEVSGWGTKVKLITETADAPEPEPVAEPVAEPVPAPEPEQESDPEPEGIAEVEIEPVAEVDPAIEPAAEKNFWQKIKSWFNSEYEPGDIFEQPVEDLAELEPVEIPEPEPQTEAELEPEPEPEAEAEPEPEPEPAAELEVEPIDYEQRMTALLDHLGSAHKRPFVNA